jgi:hypothetical protein
MNGKIVTHKYVIVDKATIEKTRDKSPKNVSPSNLVFLKQHFHGDLIDEMIQEGTFIPVDEDGNKVDRLVKSWKQKPKIVWRLNSFMKCKRCKKMIPADANYCCYCSLELPQKRPLKRTHLIDEP